MADFSKYSFDEKTLEKGKENLIEVVKRHYPKLSPKDKQDLVDTFFPPKDKADEKTNPVKGQPKAD